MIIWYKTRTTTEAVTPLNILHVQERFGQPFLLSFQASHELVVHREAVPWGNLGAFLRAQLPRHNVLRHLPSGHGSVFGYLIGPSVQRKRFNKQITQRIFFVSCGPCSDIILHGQGAKSSFWHRTYNPSCGWQNHSRMIPAWNWVKITSPSVSLLATRWQPEHDIKGFKFKKAACSGHTAYMARETET